jgi:hypothetical protein
MAQVAAIHWLGSEDIAIPAGSAYQTGVDCTVQGGEAVHVISVLPHMHEHGRRFEIARLDAGGGATPLLAGPFDRWAQRSYGVDWVLQPGEGLRVDCHYQNASAAEVLIGLRAVDEMCWVFTLAYPAGRLFNPLEPGVDGCIRHFDPSR